MEALLTLLVVVMVSGLLLVWAKPADKKAEVASKRPPARPPRPQTVAFPRNSKHPTRAYRALLQKQREAESVENHEAALLAAERALQHLPGMLAESGEIHPESEAFPCIETACRYWGAKHNHAGLESIKQLFKKLPILADRYRDHLIRASHDAAVSENMLSAIELQPGLTETELAHNLDIDRSDISRIVDALTELNLLIPTGKGEQRQVYLPKTHLRAVSQPILAHTA